jgi:hypothetical protein
MAARLSMASRVFLGSFIGPAIALGPSRREKPGACLAGLLQSTQLGRGGRERLEQGIVGERRLAQHPAAVTVEASCVLVVRGCQPSRVACCDGCDNLAVVHVLPSCLAPALPVCRNKS